MCWFSRSVFWLQVPLVTADPGAAQIAHGAELAHAGMNVSMELQSSCIELFILCVSTEKAPIRDFFFLGKPSILAKQ